MLQNYRQYSVFTLRYSVHCTVYTPDIHIICSLQCKHQYRKYRREEKGRRGGEEEGRRGERREGRRGGRENERVGKGRGSEGEWVRQHIQHEKE